jgi:hypothetical protein
MRSNIACPLNCWGFYMLCIEIIVNTVQEQGICSLASESGNSADRMGTPVDFVVARCVRSFLLIIPAVVYGYPGQQCLHCPNGSTLQSIVWSCLYYGCCTSSAQDMVTWVEIRVVSVSFGHTKPLLRGVVLVCLSWMLCSLLRWFLHQLYRL